jgi:prevent-host-death family protein
MPRRCGNCGRRRWRLAARDSYNSQMKSASISEAKNRLSAYIDRVRRGETVVITDRGRPVAQLAPLDPASEVHQDAQLAELARLGILRLPRKPPPRRLPPAVKPRREIDVARLIAEDREGR